MLDPIPLKVRDCLTELSSAQQVILRGYIGTLRADLKEKEGEILGLRDGDPNAHFHGDKMCTENHGHDSTEHGHDHGGDSTEHKHGHGHGHGHGDHKKSEGCDGHEHGHDDHKKSEGSDHGHDHNKHEHKHEHKPAEGHDHGHEHKHTDTKEKKTVEAGDPMALDWNTGN